MCVFSLVSRQTSVGTGGTNITSTFEMQSYKGSAPKIY